MKEIIKQIPRVSTAVKRIYKKLFKKKRNPEPFPGSESYWEKRYASGGNSGPGSYELLAEFKANILNRFVADNKVRTVIEFGCGDGNQLSLSEFPNYIGFDVSSTAVSHCQKLFKSDPDKSFKLMSAYRGETADLTLSLDVIFHLIEDHVFEHYMQTLFAASNRYVIIYSSNSDDNRGHEGTHVKHRKFTRWIQKNQLRWRLKQYFPNRYPYRGDYRKGSFSDFFIYEKT